MTKKAFLLIVCAWISTLAWSSERIEVNGVYYLFHGDSATVTYTGVEKLGPYTFPVSNYSGTVIVPDSVQYEGNWYHVTEVGNNAFQQSYVRSVTLPESVTKIGKAAFSGDKKLKSIIIKSAKLKSVGKKAINGIQKKVTIKVPKKQLKKYKKLFKASTGFKKTMKIK